jgi:hypothetical protein
MWPFRKKADYLGFEENEKGESSFTLTEEEQREVQHAFELFEGYKINPDVADDIQKGTTAMALSDYANEQVLISRMESQKQNRERLLEKAIAATIKAFSIYQLPIYLYDLACFMEMIGKVNESKDVFRSFLEKQSNFKPADLDMLFLKQRDIHESIKDAKMKLTN